MAPERSIRAISVISKIYLFNTYRKQKGEPVNSGQKPGSAEERPPSRSDRPKAEKFSAAEKNSARIFELNRYLNDSGGSSELIKIAKDALDEIDSVLHEMRALTKHAAGDKMTPFERSMAQNSIDGYIAEIDRIATAAEFKAARLVGKNPSGPHNPNYH